MTTMVSRLSSSTVDEAVIDALFELAANPLATLFMQPVAEEFPQISEVYLATIRRPLDLGTVFRRALSGRYSGVQGAARCARRVRRVFLNCEHFNAAVPQYREPALHLRRFFDAFWELIVARAFLEGDTSSRTASEALLQRRREWGVAWQNVGRRERLSSSESERLDRELPGVGAEPPALEEACAMFRETTTTETLERLEGVLTVRCAERALRGTDLSSSWAAPESLVWTHRLGNVNWPALLLGENNTTNLAHNLSRMESKLCEQLEAARRKKKGPGVVLLEYLGSHELGWARRDELGEDDDLDDAAQAALLVVDPGVKKKMKKKDRELHEAALREAEALRADLLRRREKDGSLEAAAAARFFSSATPAASFSSEDESSSDEEEERLSTTGIPPPKPEDLLLAPVSDGEASDSGAPPKARKRPGRPPAQKKDEGGGEEKPPKKRPRKKAAVKTLKQEDVEQQRATAAAAAAEQEGAEAVDADNLIPVAVLLESGPKRTKQCVSMKPKSKDDPVVLTTAVPTAPSKRARAPSKKGSLKAVRDLREASCAKVQAYVLKLKERFEQSPKLTTGAKRRAPPGGRNKQHGNHRPASPGMVDDDGQPEVVAKEEEQEEDAVDAGLTAREKARCWYNAQQAADRERAHAAVKAALDDETDSESECMHAWTEHPDPTVRLRARRTIKVRLEAEIEQLIAAEKQGDARALTKTDGRQKRREAGEGVISSDDESPHSRAKKTYAARRVRKAANNSSDSEDSDDDEQPDFMDFVVRAATADLQPFLDEGHPAKWPQPKPKKKRGQWKQQQRHSITSPLAAALRRRLTSSHSTISNNNNNRITSSSIIAPMARHGACD